MAKKGPAPKPTVKRRVLKAAKKEPFPWLAFLLLIVSVWAFWILPRQMGSPPVRAEFGEAER